MRRGAGYRRFAIALALACLGIAGQAAAQTGADVEALLTTIDVNQVSGQALFDVTAYVTVLDADDQPITGLGAGDFSLSEDGTAVEVADVSPARPGADIVLAIDTSGSMASQGKIEAVRQAAIVFVESLDPLDSIAIISFNETSNVLQDLSQDHVASSSLLELIPVEPATGTCLYDASYKAVILSTSAPQERRAVILLTDGVDEVLDTPGVACSMHTLQEVVDLASGGLSRSPVYTIGVGSDVNEEELRRLAEDTGGRAALTTNVGDIEELLASLNQQLKSQYALSYQSSATGGQPHSLTVTASVADGTASDQRAFFMPEPTLLVIAGVTDGETLTAGDALNAEAVVTGPAQVTRAIFLLDGQPAGEATGEPLAVRLDTGNLDPGSHSLSVEVEFADNQALERELRFVVAAPPPLPTPLAAEVESTAKPAGRLGGPAQIAIGVALVAVLGAAAAFYLLQRPVARIAGGASGYNGPEDLTRRLSVQSVLATLTVRSSAQLRTGQPIDIIAARVRLGRAADNDIVVPDDSVAPHHAEIRVDNGRFLVHGLDAESGTLVNGQPVGPDGASLREGDELALGEGTLFAFNAFTTAPLGSEAPEEAS